MSLTVRCVDCQQDYTLPDSAAGRQMRCPRGHVLAVPGSPVPVPPRPPAPSPGPTAGARRTRLPSPAPPPPPAPPVPAAPQAAGRSGGLVLLLAGAGVLMVLLLLLAGGGVAALILLSNAQPPASQPVAVAEQKPVEQPAPPAPDAPAPPANPGTGQPARGPGGALPAAPAGPGRQPGDLREAPAEPERVEPTAPILRKVGPVAKLDRLDPRKLDVKLPPPKAEDPPPPEVWDGHTNDIRGVAFTDDGKFVVSVSGDYSNDRKRPHDYSIRVWDARRGKQVHHLADFKEPLDGLSLTPGGRYALFGHGGHWEEDTFVNSTDNGVRMMDIQDKKEVAAGVVLDGTEGGGPGRGEARFPGLESSVFCTAVSPDRQYVVGGANNGQALVWDVATAKTVISGNVPSRFGFTKGVVQVQFSPDGSQVVAVSGDYTLRIYKVADGGTPARPPLVDHQDIVWALAVTQTKDGKVLALSGGGSRQRQDGKGFEPGAKDYTIRLWDLQRGQVIHRYPGSQGDVMALAFCPDGRHFLSGGTDDTVRLWDLETGKELRVLGKHADSVRSIAVAPDGRACVTGGDDSKVRFWHLPTSQDLADALDKNGLAGLEKAAGDMDVIGRDALSVFPRLVKGLGHQDPRFRQATARVLLRLAELSGPNDLPFDQIPVPNLVKVLEGDSPVELKTRVVRGLGNVGPDARAAVPALVQLAQGPDGPQVAATVAEALGKVGANTPEVVALLQKWLTNEAPAIRLQALQGLRQLGRDALKLESVLERLRKDGDKEVRARAEEIFRERLRGLTAEDVPLLRKWLGDDVAAIRLQALQALQRLGPDALPPGSLLERVQKDPDKEVQASAEKIFRERVRGLARADLPVLRKGLASPQAAVCIDCAEVVASFGADGAAAIPELTALLTRPEAAVRLAALRLLPAVSGSDKSAVPALVKLIDPGTDKRTVVQALLALNQVEPRNRALVERGIPLLMERLLEADDKVRQPAEDALGQIGRSAVGPLTSWLVDDNADRRRVAARALGKVGPAAEKAIPDLEKVLLEEEKGAVRREAAEALGHLGPKALPVLTAQLANADEKVRQAAAEGLGAMGPAAAPAIPELARLVADPKRTVSRAAGKALEKIDPNWEKRVGK